MNIPVWFNTDLCESVVRNGFNLTDFTISNTEICEGTSPGDNYCSKIYRVYVDVTDDQGKEQKLQFLIKHLLNSERGAKVMEFMNSLEKEIDMFKNIIPRLTEIAGGRKFAAKYYHSLSELKTKLIIMEDLKELQYRMVERKEGLDWDHCVLVLRKLGQWHAASMVLAQEDPSLMDKYNFGNFHGSENNPGILQSFLDLNFPTLCEVIKEWKGFEDISRKLDKMKDNFWKIAYESASRKNDGYRVLNHGDFWITNFLFNYDEESEKPIETLFVDLQTSYYTSPANDLQYFFNSTPQTHIRENQREDLLHIYYDSFEKTLKDVDHKNIPTFQDLQIEMGKKEMFGFITAVIILPLTLMDAQLSEGSDFDDMVDPKVAQEMTRIMFSRKCFTESMKCVLRRYDRLGLFDTV